MIHKLVLCGIIEHGRTFLNKLGSLCFLSNAKMLRTTYALFEEFFWGSREDHLKWEKGQEMVTENGCNYSIE